MKNPTPRQIVLRTTLIIFSLIAILELISFFVKALNNHWYHLFIIPVLTFIVSYAIFYGAVENFIYRKIKLIYKNIHSLKSTKEIADQKLNMSRDILDEVNDEVVEWDEDRRLEIEQLKKLEVYRKEFLGNISHELKTPITSIQGYLETLIDGGLEDPDINREYLTKAMQNVERMISTVEDLESISHLESGELQLNYSSFDVNDLTKEVFENFEITAGQMKIKLRIKEGCDATFMVWADKKLIREAIVNLISNAIKYGKDNGLVHVGFYNMAENILIEVSDNGIGIPKEHLPRVFERFYRVEKSRSRSFGGTGLGLAIVKHIIEAHNQTVSVRSTPGEESTFGFTLKRAKDQSRFMHL